MRWKQKIMESLWVNSIKFYWKKIEELTLHAIETKKQIQQQDKEISALKQLINDHLPPQQVASTSNAQ